MKREWQLQDAQERLEELVEHALAGEVQVIMQDGKEAAVMLAYDDYEMLRKNQKSLLDIFSTAPRMDEEELPLERDKTPIKPFNFDE